MSQQTWKFYCFSRESVAITPDDHKHGDSLVKNLDKKQDLLVRSITRPVTRPLIDKLLEGYTEPMDQPCKFLALPKDILTMIYEDFLPDEWWKERVCLSITCKYLLAFGRRGIEHIRDTEAADWYLCRVACVGSHADFTDLLRHFFNDTTYEYLKQLTSHKCRRLITPKGEQRPPPKPLQGFPRGGRSPRLMPSDWVPPLDIKKPCDDEEKLLNKAYFGGLEFYPFRSTMVYKGVHQLIKLEWMPPGLSDVDMGLYRALVGCHYPQDKEWYLFNETKRQYVRARAIAELCGQPDDEQPFLPRCKVGLGNVLFLKTCWSSLNEVKLEMKEPMYHGSWAGDRFIITPGPEYIQLEALSKTEYTDVTEGVIQGLKDLVEYYYGKDSFESYVKEERRPKLWEYCWYASDNATGVGRWCDRKYSYRR